MAGIEKYTTEWSRKYEFEAEKIKAVLSEDIKNIQHIGSTAIPGMMAKPLIDIGVLVDSIDDAGYFTGKLGPLGYSYKPELSSGERIFFRKGDPIEYHLSIACPKHAFWKRQITFRDYLRNHPELVEEYNDLKMKNLENTPKEDLADLSLSEAYNQSKGDFVKKVLKLAELENNLVRKP